MLCIIKFLLQTVNPKTNFTDNLKSLFTEYPNVDIRAMDFPSDWEKELLWQ